MIKRFIPSLLIILFFIDLGSCVSDHHTPRELPDLREVSIQEFEQQLEEEDAALAWETNDNLLERSLLTQVEHDANRIRISELFTRLLSESLEQKNYRKYLRIFSSMSSAGIHAEGSVPDESLVKEYFTSLLDEGKRIQAYALATEGPLKNITGDDTAAMLGEDALGSGYSGWARYLGKTLEDKNSEGIRKDLPGIVDSTVTIWVNRGMRIESGMGYLDRVIGSGFFIDKEGYLLTNYHVIESEVNPEYEGFSRLFIRKSISSGTKIPAKVIGWDSVLDLALLKAEVTPEYTFSPGGEKLSLGEPIYAIGSPGGLERTITSGIVSAVDRRLLQIGDALQVDVPINQGNSGGPLLDEKGNLVGIVFAGIESFEGINFAIPVYWLVNILPALYRGGEVEHSWIGVALNEGQDGLVALYSAPGSPAARSGVLEGDKLLSVNGTSVVSVRDIHAMMLGMEPDTLIKTVWDTADGKRQDLWLFRSDRSLRL